jgi:hypothetical protein
MLKRFTLLSCILLVCTSALLIGSGSLRSQTTHMSSEELRAFRLKQIMDAYDEKRHMDEGNTPGQKSSGGDQDGSESPLTAGQKAVSTGTPESEVHAAINPTDTTNIVVGPIHISPASGMILPIYYTTNFGASWTKSSYQAIPYEFGAQISGGGDPVFAFDADGKVYMSWIDRHIRQRFFWRLCWMDH